MTDSDNQKGNTMSDDSLAHSDMLSEEDFLAHVGVTPDMSEDDILEHFGVKGMKWGRRAAGEAFLGGAAKARTSTGNDKSRREGRAERNAAIDAARARIHGGESKRNVKEAKVAYKAAKKTDGAQAAKDALAVARQKRADDYHDSRLIKSGGEAAASALLTVGALALIAASSR